MPALLLPVGIPAPSVAPDDSLPTLFQTNRLPDCPVTVTTTPSGSLWQQELRINGFMLGLQSINLPPGSMLDLSCGVESAVLLYALKGNLAFEIGTGPAITIREMQYCLITCRTDSRITLSVAAGLTHLFQLAFSLRMLQKLPGGSSPVDAGRKNEIADGIKILPYLLPVTIPIQQLFIKLTSPGLKTGMNNIIRSNEICLNLLKRFISDRAVFLAQQRWAEQKLLSITELVLFLQDHLDAASRKQVTPSACAKRTRLDTASFKRLFKSHYRMTLSKYLYRQRMQRAFDLLRSGQLPGGIYGEVGYHNFSSFSRAYSNYFGKPPSAASTENR